MPAPLKPIIYIAFANDLENPGRNLSGLAQERANIEAAIRDTPGAPRQEDRLDELLRSWELIANDDLTPRSLTQPFYSNRVAIFHYGGHAGPEALLLETEEGKNIAASAETVIPFLRDQTSLKLIFLNACSTKQWALTLAQNAGGAFCIVATSCPVQDPIAKQFAHDFYNCLASDGTLQDAFDKAIHGANVHLTGAARGFGVPEHNTHGLPWALYPPGPCDAKNWRLSTALRNPLLGIPALGPEYEIPPCPYVSIRGHQKEDAQIFFGRNAEIREIYDWALHETATPVMLFYGQSGSGKSSLLRAGVWPRLEGRASVGYFRREEDLTDDLNLGLSWTTHIPDPGQAATAWLHSETPAIILLDQLEESITHRAGSKASNDELSRFFQRIVDLFIDPQTGQRRLPRTNARLILSFRKEFLAEIRNPLVTRIPSLVRDLWLERLTEQNIIDIVEGPMLSDKLRAQYKIALEAKTDQASGFAEYLAGRLYDPLSPVATILELELNRLWDLWHPTDPRQMQAIQDPAGIFQQELRACRAQKDPLGRDQSDAALCYSRKLYDLVASSDALQEFLTDQLRSIADPRVSKGLELDLLYEHTSGLATAQRRSLTELMALYESRIHPTNIDDLVSRNKELHLLADVADEPAEGAASAPQAADPQQEPATVLAHDTLAPVVRREFALSQNPGQRARRILEDRARGWQSGQKGDRLDAADLRVVAKGLRHMRTVTKAEARLIRASRRRHRWHMAFISAVVLLAVVVAATASWDQFQGLKRLTSMQLADAAIVSVNENYDLALLLSAAAYEIQPTPQVTNAVLALLIARPDALAVLSPHTMGTGFPVFSANGSRLLTTAGSSFDLWDVGSHKSLWDVPNGIGNGPGDLYQAAALGPKGLIALADSHAVQLWQTEGHRLLSRALPGSGTPARSMNYVGSLSFSRDGRYLAAARCNGIQVWTLSGSHPLGFPQTLPIANPPCGDFPSIEIAFDPADSSILAVWSATGEVWLTDLQTGALISTLRQPGGNFQFRGEGIAFSGDGTRLAASTMAGGIDLFNVPARTPIGSIQPEHLAAAYAGDLTSFGLSADGSRLAAAMGDGSVGVWDTATRIMVKPFADGGSSAANTTAFSPDLTKAAVQALQGSILLLDLTQSVGPLPATPNLDSLVTLAVSPDGKWIASGTVHGHVILWDTASLKPVWSFAGPDTLVTGAAFTPDSRTLLFPRPGTRLAPMIALHRLDIATRRLMSDLTDKPLDGESTLYTVGAVSGGRIVALSDTGVLHVWDADGQPTTITGAADGQEFAGFAISPDGGLLAAAGAGLSSVAFLQFAAPRPVPRVLPAAERRIEALAFSSDTTATGSGLLAEGGENGFWLWNLPSGPQTFKGRDPTTSLAFSPDGSLLLLGLGYGQVELWNVAQNRVAGPPLETPQPDFDQLPFGVAFSPDGKRMYADGSKGTFRVWDWNRLPLGDLTHHLSEWPALACSIAGQNLSHDQWRQYVGSVLPYRKVCPNLPEGR